MNVFVFESITGGGLARHPLPTGLAAEGDRMLRALAGDLCGIPGVDVTITRDARLPPLPAAARAITIDASHDIASVFLDLVSRADAVWPIAPESGGELERLSRAVLSCHRVLLGSRPEAISIAASKRKTAEVLNAAGMATPPAFADPLEIPALPGAWIVKPDDGAGCIDTIRVGDSRQAATILASRPGANLIAQPWIPGEAWSVSVICSGRDTTVLSCNRQLIAIDEGVLALHGVEVAAGPVTPAHRDLARRVASAIPGLWGYVGIDLVETASGPVVIEVNPRLTTSYCDLGSVLGINPAQSVLRLLAGRGDPAYGEEIVESGVPAPPFRARLAQHG